MTVWYLYIIRTEQSTLYTGITTHVADRLEAHRKGRSGAKYLRSRGPLTLVYEVPIGGRSLASKAEYRIKRLPKRKKEKIVEEHPDRVTLLKMLRLC